MAITAVESVFFST